MPMFFIFLINKIVPCDNVIMNDIKVEKYLESLLFDSLKK